MGRPSAGVRIALQALDAACDVSAWETTGVIPRAADEEARYPPDAGGATRPPAANGRMHSGCSR
jgi:hypothetical protein